jgi:hypothetical protein
VSQQNFGFGFECLIARKIATSKNPRMLTPLETDLLSQNLRAAPKPFGQDGIDDARAFMCKHGLRTDDFEITQRASSSLAFPSDITGTVTLMRKINSMAQSYDAASGSPGCRGSRLI